MRLKSSKRKFCPRYSLCFHASFRPTASTRLSSDCKTALYGRSRQISPILTSLSVDSTQMAGTNLVFEQLTVGTTGKPFPPACSRPTDCTVKYPSGTAKGYLYFVARAGQGESGLIPVVLQQAQGVAKVLYTPPEKGASKAEEKPTPQVVPTKPKVHLSSSTE